MPGAFRRRHMSYGAKPARNMFSRSRFEYKFRTNYLSQTQVLTAAASKQRRWTLPIISDCSNLTIDKYDFLQDWGLKDELFENVFKFQQSTFDLETIYTDGKNYESKKISSGVLIGSSTWGNDTDAIHSLTGVISFHSVAPHICKLSEGRTVPLNDASEIPYWDNKGRIWDRLQIQIASCQIPCQIIKEKDINDTFESPFCVDNNDIAYVRLSSKVPHSKYMLVDDRSNQDILKDSETMVLCAVNNFTSADCYDGHQCSDLLARTIWGENGSRVLSCLKKSEIGKLFDSNYFKFRREYLRKHGSIDATNDEILYELARVLNKNQLSAFLSFLESHGGGGISFDGTTVAAIASTDNVFPFEVGKIRNQLSFWTKFHLIYEWIGKLLRLKPKLVYSESVLTRINPNDAKKVLSVEGSYAKQKE